MNIHLSCFANSGVISVVLLRNSLKIQIDKYQLFFWEQNQFTISKHGLPQKECLIITIRNASTVPLVW